MANRKLRGNSYRGVHIDSAPGANGYFTDSVRPNEYGVGSLILSFGNIGSNTVTLQFKPAGESSWRTYKEFTSADDPRQIIEDYTDCEYRAGIASGDFSSTMRVLIDFHPE